MLAPRGSGSATWLMSAPEDAAPDRGVTTTAGPVVPETQPERLRTAPWRTVHRPVMWRLPPFSLPFDSREVRFASDSAGPVAG